MDTPKFASVLVNSESMYGTGQLPKFELIVQGGRAGGTSLTRTVPCSSVWRVVQVKSGNLLDFVATDIFTVDKVDVGPERLISGSHVQNGSTKCSVGVAPLCSERKLGDSTAEGR